MKTIEQALTKAAQVLIFEKKDDNDLIEILEQAIQIEKDQIIDAHYQGYRNDIGTTEVSEQYYNEIYGGQGSPDTTTSPNTQNK